MQPLAAVVILLWSSGALAAADIAGAADPLTLERFPHSWIVEYQKDEAVLAREFIVGRVDKTRRDVRTEGKIRTEAALESATYRIPSGTPRREVVDHYLRLLGGDTLFSCYGRDCGRSNHWANYIFRQAQLYGPDRNQFYLAARLEDQLVAVYVIERGNKRIYAHLLVISPTGTAGGAVGARVIEQLRRNSFVVVPNVLPFVDGRLPADSAKTLGDLGADLAAAAAAAGHALDRVYVVCHIYGATGSAGSLAAAKDCSDRAVQHLSVDGGPQLEPFAAGPMLPRPSLNSRIELVLPPQVREE